MKRLLGIVLCLALALPMMAQEEELCIDGTLLFREDFGGARRERKAVRDGEG